MEAVAGLPAIAHNRCPRRSDEKPAVTDLRVGAISSGTGQNHSGGACRIGGFERNDDVAAEIIQHISFEVRATMTDLRIGVGSREDRIGQANLNPDRVRGQVRQGDAHTHVAGPILSRGAYGSASDQPPAAVADLRVAVFQTAIKF